MTGFSASGARSCFSTLRRVYRWCNLTFTLGVGGAPVVSVPSDGSTGGVTMPVSHGIKKVPQFQYPQTGLQVV